MRQRLFATIRGHDAIFSENGYGPSQFKELQFIYHDDLKHKNNQRKRKEEKNVPIS